MPRSRWRGAVALGGAAVALLAAGGAAGWVSGRAGRERIPALERRVGDLERRAAALAADRDRIKAERDRLEAQIAAARETPRACPRPTLSTADAGLQVPFAVDYPCGWSVLERPLERPQRDPARAGLILDELLLGAGPISLAPRDGPPTDIVLDSWSDDPDVAGDALPPLDRWLADARARFRQVSEGRLRTVSGIAVTRLAGTMVLFDEPRPAALYVWEFVDREGRRRICEAFALDASRTVTQTLDALVRSFRPLGG
jgi:hypothetical protein